MNDLAGYICKKSTMPKEIKSVADYLATLSEKQRLSAEKLIRIVQTAAPELEEGLTYSTPAYKLNGKPVVGIAAAKAHIGFYVMSEPVMNAFKNELKGYDTAKTSIRFPLDEVFPAPLIKKIVTARVKEAKKA